jgi:hypothetical protein
MIFNSKSGGKVIAGVVLATALVANGWAGYFNPTRTRTQVAFAQQESFQPDEQSLIVPAMLQAQAYGPQTVLVEHQHARAWYKNKHWWKRNAPIIGGAGGGAIIGGLAGGGTGAVIGGAAGGGGGYLYKRLKHSHHHEYPQQNYQHAHH